MTPDKFWRGENRRQPDNEQLRASIDQIEDPQMRAFAAELARTVTGRLDTMVQEVRVFIRWAKVQLRVAEFWVAVVTALVVIAYLIGQANNGDRITDQPPPPQGLPQTAAGNGPYVVAIQYDLTIPAQSTVDVITDTRFGGSENHVELIRTGSFSVSSPRTIPGNVRPG